MLPTTVAYDRSHQARLLRLLDIVLPVAHPDSNKRMAWNLGIMLLVFASALLVPFNLAFDDEFALETRRGFHVADMLFDCIFLFDILLNFRIGYDKDGFFVQDAYLVANHYLKGYFVLDCVSSFPLALLFPFDEDEPTHFYSNSSLVEEDSGQSAAALAKLNRLLRLIRLAKLLRMLKLLRIFKALAEGASLNPGVYRLLALALFMMWASHCTGCLWYLVISLGTLESYREQWDAGTYPHESRYPFNELIDASTAYDKWLLCFCWSIGMVTGLMPMDVMPSRSEEVRAQVPWWS